MTSDGYLLENRAPQTEGRFAGLSAVFDPGTVVHLEALGVGPGWQCLEIGAGGPSIPRWLAERVGQTGRVVATDLDTRWLEAAELPHVELRRHDVANDPLEEDHFDLVHARLVLVHVPGRLQALRRMFSAVRPGGWLCIEDFDCVTVPPFVEPQGPAEELATRYNEAFYRLLASRGADLHFGSRLPRLLCRLGLLDVRAAGRIIYGGPGIGQVVTANTEQVRAGLVAEGLTDDDIDRYIAMVADPDFPMSLPLMVAAWGRRPLHRETPKPQEPTRL